MMNTQDSNMAANAICHAAEACADNIRQAFADFGTPATLFRPKLSVDGDMWCALYGDDLQSGVAGFGKSPAKAMHDFNINWYKDLGAKP